MNIALITAAGKGERTKQDTPKQFLCIDTKPIIIYTLEAFQQHPAIDVIMVVCLDGWHDVLREYAKQFNITKLNWVISGGETGQESIYNGLSALCGNCSDDDFVFIHDGNRSLVSSGIISNSMAVVIKYGNAITAIPCNDVVAICHNGHSSTECIDRSALKRTQTPQVFVYKRIFELYKKAFEQGIKCLSPCDLMVQLREPIFFSDGSERNIKITTPEDIELFKALLKTEKDVYS